MQPSPARRRLPWPKRFDVAILGFAAQLIAYCDRVNLSVAAPMIAAENHWSPAQMGVVLSGFFAGYMALMIPIGFVADRIGPKRTLAGGMFWWSLITVATPFCRTVPLMTATRVLIGMGESGTIPSINAMLVRWFPPGEFSRAAGICWGGGFAGAILAFPLASAILSAWGWRAIFAIFSLLGLLWLPFWILGTSDGPQGEDTSRRPRTSLTAIAGLLKEPAVWSLFLLHLSSNWYVYVLATWLPTYLMNSRGFSLSQMAFGSSLPFLCAFLGTTASGMGIDRLTFGRNRARVRKLFLLPSLAGTALMLLVPAVSSPPAIVAVLCLSMFLHAAVLPVQASNSMDISPSHTGTLTGVQNCFANIAGILAPAVTGYVVQTAGWLPVFQLTLAVGVIGVSAFLLFGKSEPLARGV